MLQTQPAPRIEYNGRLRTIAQIESRRSYNRKWMRARRGGHSAGEMCSFCHRLPARTKVDRLRISDSGAFCRVKVKWCGTC